MPRPLLLAALCVVFLLPGCTSTPEPVAEPVVAQPTDPLLTDPALASWRTANAELFAARDLGAPSSLKSRFLWASNGDVRRELREVGTLTDDHFATLERLVEDAPEIDASILPIVARGGFDPERVAEMVAAADQPIRTKLDEALRDFVGRRAFATVRAGIRQTVGLDAGSAGTIVRALEGGEAKSEIARTSLAEIRPDTVGSAVGIVADTPDRATLLTNWFAAPERKKIRTTANLQEMATSYEGKERVQLTSAFVGKVRDLDADKLLALLETIPEADRWPIFDEGLGNVDSVNVDQLIALSRSMAKKRCNAAVVAGLEHLDAPSVDKGRELIAAVDQEDALRKVSVAAARKVGDLDADGLLRLVDGLEGRVRDDALAAGMRRMPTISVEQSIKVVQAAAARQRGLAVMAARTLTNLDVDGLVQLAETVEHDAKDDVLRSGLPRLPRLDASDVRRLSGAAYNRRTELTVAALRRSRGLIAANLSSLAEELRGPARDTVILAGLPKLDRLTPKELAQLIESAHAKKEVVAKAGLTLISALSIEGLAIIVEPLERQKQAHDDILKFGIQYIGALDVEDVDRLVALAVLDAEPIKTECQQRLAEQRLERRRRAALEAERARLEQARSLNPEVPDDDDN